MSRLAPLSELNILYFNPHRRNPNSRTSYIYSPDFIPGKCPGGRYILTGAQAENYNDGKPITISCPGCGEMVITRKQ